MRPFKKSILALSLNVTLLTISSLILFSCSGQKKVAGSEPETVQQKSTTKEEQNISSREVQDVKSAPRIETRTHL